MQKMYDNAIKHLIEMEVSSQYIKDFYVGKHDIMTDIICSLPYSADELLDATDEMIKITDENSKFELIILKSTELKSLTDRILNVLKDRGDCDLIMTTSLCNYIEELYKSFKDGVDEIIGNLLKIATIPKLVDMINELKSKICDLRTSSISELLEKNKDNSNSKSYRFTNDEEDK